MTLINYDGQKVEMHDQFSWKIFRGIFVDIPDGMNVYHSDFSKEIADIHIFRDDMKGVTFYNCNLDNIFIPEGNTLIGCTNDRMARQNDYRDWYIDEEDKPVKLVNEDQWIERGTWTDPARIPKDFHRIEKMTATQYQKALKNGDIAKWFKATPSVIPLIFSQKILPAKTANAELTELEADHVIVEGSGHLSINGVERKLHIPNFEEYINKL